MNGINGKISNFAPVPPKILRKLIPSIDNKSKNIEKKEKKKLKKNNVSVNVKKIGCELCKIPSILNEKQLADHTGGKRHQRNLKELNEKFGRNYACILGCKPCNIDYFMDKTKLEEHVKGKKHMRQLQQLAKQSEVSTSCLDKGRKEDVLMEYPCTDVSKDGVKECDNENSTNHKDLIVQPDTADSSSQLGPIEMEMMSALSKSPTLDLQVCTFLGYITPVHRHVVELYYKVKFDMVEALNRVFPSCVVYHFGSAITSLQFTSSNLDIFVDIKDDEDCMKKAGNALLRDCRFENICHLYYANIPFMECQHIKTKITCRVNFKSMIGVKNSELIRHYVSMDVKVRYFMLVIKYWAKVQGLTKKDLFTNYSLVLICIFYLQQSRSFPSVHLLQNGTIPNNPKILWNVNVPQSAKYSVKLHGSLLSLLLDFFAFYSDFNYESDIICPYLGKPVKRTLFLSENTIPEEFCIYKEKKERYAIKPLKCDGPICVQDPFEHNVNVCEKVFLETLSLFVSKCHDAVLLLKKEDQINMLHSLFTEYGKKAYVIQNLIFSESTTDKPYIIHFRMIKHFKMSDRIDSLKNIENTLLWHERIRNFLKIVFKNIFKCKFYKINDGVSKLPRLGDESDETTETTYKAICYMDVWNAREERSKNLEERLGRCMTTIGRETLVSEYLWSLSKKHNRKLSILLECEITLVCFKNPAKAKLWFLPNYKLPGTKLSFPSFFKFCKSKLGYWLKLHEKDLNIF